MMTAAPQVASLEPRQSGAAPQAQESVGSGYNNQGAHRSVRSNIPGSKRTNTAPNTNGTLPSVNHQDWDNASCTPSTASGHPQMVYNTEGMTVRQLPWTEADTKEVMAQIKFMQEELLGGRGAVNENIKLWKEGLNDLKARLEATMNGNGNNSQTGNLGMLSRADPLLKKLTSTMRGINLVDLPKLVKLMQGSQVAGDCIEGKDVILLCGETGAGKTTTMQFLAGTSFEEVEEDGFVHLNPVTFLDEAHKKFKTSYNREPTTRCLQAATVRKGGGEEIAICDVPSYDVANCLEEDIALGMGMVQAIRRAKSVRPVVVLSREGMGNRFSNLPDAMKTVSRICNVQVKEDWLPFSYVFTKYEGRHRSMLHKQFLALQRNPPTVGKADTQELYEAFIEDIAAKTNPEAQVVLPMEGRPANLLSTLHESPMAKASPQDLCAGFSSDFSVKQMQLQMGVQLHNFRGLLLLEDYPGAIQSIKNMIDMSHLFTDMQSYIHQAKEAFLQQVAQVWVLVVRSIGKQDYHTALYRMDQLNTIAKDFPDAVECLELGHEMLSQSVTEPIAAKEYDKAIRRLISLGTLVPRFTEAMQAVTLGLSILRENLIAEVEANNFTTAISLIRKLGYAWASEGSVADAFAVAQHGLHLVQERLMMMIESENYNDGIALTMQVSSLGQHFAEANVYVRRILKIMRKRVDQTVQRGDFVKAGYLLRNLSNLAPRLHDGAEYVEFAFDVAAQHVCELRMEVVNAFEALLKLKDQKKFTQLLEYGSTSMNNLMKSEPIRLVCADFYKTKQNPQKDQADTFKPNYLAILCTPKECSSEAFCVAQVRHLVETISTELSELETDNTTAEYLMSHRKTLLSVILRLRGAAKVFKEGPGGTMAASMYEKEFSKFQALIAGILDLSEASFDSSMEMKEFEFQTWFLAFLIQGFTKEITRNDKSDDTQVIEDLDHRRVTLMLRFENEISDTVELLSNYTFPDLTARTMTDFSVFFQEVKLKDLEAPRQLLMSLSQAPQLCKMMATMVSAKEAQESVSKLDRSLVDLFARIVKYLEENYDKLVLELKDGRASRKVALHDARKIVRDVELIRPEAVSGQSWSEVTMSGLSPLLLRMTEILDTAQKLVNKLDERSLLEDDISPAAFVMSIFSGGSRDGPLCACFGGGSQEEFFAALPLLSETTLSIPKPTPVIVHESREGVEAGFESPENRDDSSERLPSPVPSSTGTEIDDRASTPAMSTYRGYDENSSRAPTPANAIRNNPLADMEPIDP